MTHAGRSVIVSGSTVAVGLLSMVILPLPFIRSIGIGGMLIPLVSVLAAITLLPAMLAVLGTRINSVRVMPKRLVDQGHPEDGAWGRWARFVVRRPWPVAIAGLAIVGVLVGLGTQLNPNEAQLKNFPGTGTAIAGRAQLAAAGISPGVMKPLDVLVENGGNAEQIAAKLRTRAGHRRRDARLPGWHRGQDALVEAFPAIDGSAPGIQGIIDRAKHALEGHATGRSPASPRSTATSCTRSTGQLPLRARVRGDPDADPAHAGVPLDRAGGQGGDPQPALAGRPRSGSSSSSSRRATAPRSGTSARPRRSPPGSR